MIVSAGEGAWSVEVKLGQLLSIDVNAVNVGLSDLFTDTVSLHIQAAAGLVSVDGSTYNVQSCTLIKVSTAWLVLIAAT